MTPEHKAVLGHFQEQLDRTDINTEEFVESLIQEREAEGLNSNTVATTWPVGDKTLRVIYSPSPGVLNLEFITAESLRKLSTTHEFVRMAPEDIPVMRPLPKDQVDMEDED